MSNSAYINSGLGYSRLEEWKAQIGRNRKREALQQLGFVWIKTSGVPPDQQWNIDNWPDKSLDNIYRAYQEFGGIVADLHNRKKFYPENTQSYVSIRSIVNEYKDEYIPNSRTDTGGNDTNNTVQQPVYTQAGYSPGAGMPVWAVIGGVALIGTGFLIILAQN